MTNNHTYKILSDLKNGEKSTKPLCIFDLDSTLYNVSPRTQKIILDFSLDIDFKKKFPEETKKLSKVNIMAHDWGFSEALERENFHGSVLFFKALTQYWRKHFFSNEYMIHDLTYPKAKEFVWLVKNMGYTICYLTGRNQDLMKRGSIENLKRDLFPIDDQDFIIMKTEKKLHDSIFKAREIKQLKQQFDYILFFENEPTIINQVNLDHPEVKTFFIDSTHSRQETLNQEIPIINKDFTPLLPVSN